MSYSSPFVAVGTNCTIFIIYSIGTGKESCFSFDLKTKYRDGMIFGTLHDNLWVVYCISVDAAGQILFMCSTGKVSSPWSSMQLSAYLLLKHHKDVDSKRFPAFKKQSNPLCLPCVQSRYKANPSNPNALPMSSKVYSLHAYYFSSKTQKEFVLGIDRRLISTGNVYSVCLLRLIRPLVPLPISYSPCVLCSKSMF